ncbi:MAG TPA: hypothetical protein ENI80_07330 [Acidiferrobacteraceae bacterium]|nr:hypothetical protein [Acidiferrobacteraceae bacterium]
MLDPPCSVGFDAGCNLPGHGSVKRWVSWKQTVKIVKNRASGYRNLHNFADMIYLTVGDLDIPAQIPSGLRTL